MAIRAARELPGAYGRRYRTVPMAFEAVEEKETEDEIRSISSTDEELDITDIVRDTLLLAIPVRKIAPGAEEAEIPVAFGAPADADLDPRWEALKALKNEKSGD